MKVYNLTNALVEIPVYDRISGREYSIYVQGNARADLEGIYMNPRIAALIQNGIIRLVDTPTHQPITIENLPEIPPQEIEAPLVEAQESEEEEEEKSAETAVTTEDAFICPQCHAEFGSQRGLTMHIAKAHPQSETE